MVEDHLSQEQIDHYVSRSGDADEILSVAEHLEACFDCRDRMAAMIDSGAGERPRGGRRISGRMSAIHDIGEPSRIARALPWIIGAIIVVAIALLWVVSRT